MPLPKSLSRVSDLAQGFRSDDWRDSLPLWVSAGLVLVRAIASLTVHTIFG